MQGEIHILFVGDHGQGSYNQSFQVCNVESPKSKLNTEVINLFDAKDVKANLKTALMQYQDQLQELQHSEWR